MGSDEEAQRVSPSAGARRLKPKSLNTDVSQVSSVAKSGKEATPKHNAATRNNCSSNKTSSNSNPVSKTMTKPEPIKGKEKVMTQKAKSKTGTDQVSLSSAAETETVEEKNKENMVKSSTFHAITNDVPLTEESSLSGVDAGGVLHEIMPEEPWLNI